MHIPWARGGKSIRREKTITFGIDYNYSRFYTKDTRLGSE